MHPAHPKCKPSHAVATIRPANDAGPVALIEGEMTPKLATILAELCSVGAMVTEDRVAKQCMLQATSELFNARAAMERAMRRKAGAA